MSEEREELCLGGGFSWRKGLPSVTKAKSVLLLQRLHNIAPLILLEFHPDTAAETFDWLLGKITRAESLGGADLLGRVIGETKAAGTVVAIGATSERLLLEADEELLFRPKPFCCSREPQPSTACDPLHPGEAEGLCGMLSSAEAVNLVQKILSQLTVGEREEVLGVSMLPGEPVMDSLRRHGIITDSYPLHDAPQLAHLRQTLRASWGGLKSFTQTDQRHLLEEIKGYFGEGVAHYFGFLGFFINALFLKSLLAVVLYNFHLSNSWSLIFFSFSNMIWSGLFLQGWKQRSESLEGPKGQRSSSCPSDSTGLKDASDLPQQQRGNNPVNVCRNTFRQSMLFLVSMFLLSSVVILVYFHLDTIIWNFSCKKQTSTITQTLSYLPDISLAMAMEGLDHIALKFSHLYAKPLHQGSQARLYQPLLPELVLISIYTHFAVHFYRALIQHDLITLHHHLTVQLVTQTALHLLIRGLLPFLLQKRTEKLPGHWQLERQPPFLKQIQDQISRPTRNSIETKGHINMLIAYCHVMLFSGIYPLCALWCLLGTAAQSHLDFWQMCVFFRRPFPQATSGTEHTWHCLFEIVDLLSTVANAMLLWTSSDFQLFLSGLSQWEVVKITLGLLLLLMGLKMAVMSAASRIFSSSDPQAEQPRLRHLGQYRLHCQ